MKNQSNVGRSNSSSSKCCATPWLLYLLVIVALVLSGLNFWMNLYRHEQLRSEVRDLEARINSTKDKVQNPKFVEMYLKENLNQELMNKDSVKRCQITHFHPATFLTLENYISLIS